MPQHDTAPSHSTVTTSPNILTSPELAKTYGIPDQQEQHVFDELRIPPARTTPDAVLQWPIFGNLYPANYITDAVFEAHAEDEYDPDSQDSIPYQHHPAKPRLSRSSGGGGVGIDEDAIPDLVQKFLELVHVKNPILDTDTILSYAHHVAEEGLRWDAPSCLVVCPHCHLSLQIMHNC